MTVGHSHVGICPKSGKRQYASRGKARDALKSTHNRVRLYICPACHYWHGTSQVKP